MEVDQESRKKLVMGSVAIIAILGVGVLLANYFGLFGGRVAGAPRIIADEPLAQTPEGKQDLAHQEQVVAKIRATAKTDGN